MCSNIDLVLKFRYLREYLLLRNVPDYKWPEKKGLVCDSGTAKLVRNF